MVDNIPMLRANLCDNPMNSVTNRNSVPPISMSFRMLPSSSTGLDVITIATANHTEIVAMNG